VRLRDVLVRQPSTYPRSCGLELDLVVLQVGAERWLAVDVAAPALYGVLPVHAGTPYFGECKSP